MSDEELVPLGEAAAEAAADALRLDRAPPHATDAEAAVIGCALIDPSVIDAVIDTGMKPGHMFRPQNATMWSTVLALHLSGSPVDTLTVTEDLRKHGALEAVGGAAAVACVEAMLPTSAHAATYARMVHEKAQMRGVIEAGRQMTEAAYRGGKPAIEVIDAAERMIFALGQSATSGLQVSNRRAELTDIADTLGEVRAGTLSTAFPEVDEILDGGPKPGQVIVIGARPSVGKSALGLTLAHRFDTKNGARSVYYSLEMPAREQHQREIATVAGVSLHAFKKPTREERAKIAGAVATLVDSRVDIVARGEITYGEIASHARREVTKKGTAVIVVDHLHIMGGVDAQREVADYGAITRSLKGLAINTNAVVILLAQLNRNSEKRDDKRPTLADLRASGNIEADADIVILLHRPEMALGDKCKDERRGICELIFAKNRNGPLGVVDLRYHGPTLRFSSVPQDQRAPVDPRPYDDDRWGDR